MEGAVFTCPWTARTIAAGDRYDLDHLVPLAVYPINELWNLVPSDPTFNSRQKRDRLPSSQRLERAMPHLTTTYRQYDQSPPLSRALREDAAVRFASLPADAGTRPPALARATITFIEQIAAARNLARFI